MIAMPASTLGISCTEDYYAKILRLAKSQQRTISSMGRVLMDAGIEALEAKGELPRSGDLSREREGG